MNYMYPVRIIVVCFFTCIFLISYIGGIAGADESLETSAFETTNFGSVDLSQPHTISDIIEGSVIITEETSDDKIPYDPALQFEKLQAAIETANTQAANDSANLSEALIRADDISVNISEALEKIAIVSEIAAEKRAALDAALAGTTGY